LDDLKNVGESSYSPGDGTDQRVQSLVFMMMMIIIMINVVGLCGCEAGPAGPLQGKNINYKLRSEVAVALL